MRPLGMVAIGLVIVAVMFALGLAGWAVRRVERLVLE